jgi:hypothetical protein
MAVNIEIGGVDKTAVVKRGSLRISKDDAVETCSVTTFAADRTSAAYRPSLGDVLHVTQDATLLFGGVIEDVRDRASDGLNAGGTEVEATAVGYHTLPDRLLVTADYPAGTGAYDVYSALCALLTTYYGVTNIGTPSGGVALPALVFDHVTVTAALNQLNTITAGLGAPMLWRINGDKQFAAQLVGSDTGPTYTAANSTVIRSFGWQASSAQRVTRVWAKCGAAGEANARTQVWTGDGSRVNFYLDVDPYAAPTSVTEGGTPITVPSGTWTYDGTRRRLVRSSPLGLGVSLSATYTVYYPAYCRAEDETAVDAGDLVEAVVAYADVTDLDQGVSLAAGHLSQHTSSPKRVTLQTRTNVYPLQLCPLTFTARTISGSYLSRRVTISDLGARSGVSNALLYDVELWQTSALGGTWLDWWRDRGASTSGGSVVVTGGTPGGGTTIVQGTTACYLGGSRLVAVQTPASTYVTHPEFVDVILDSADLPATVTLNVQCWTSTGSVSVTPRVIAGTGAAGYDSNGDWNNKTTVGTGSASTGTVASSSWQAVTVTPRSGVYAYRLQLAASAATTDVWAAGAQLQW